MPDSDPQQQFLEAEHLVELHSAELKKELRLGDLVLSQVLYIIGLMWLGTAGKVGSSHITVSYTHLTLPTIYSV